MAQSEEEEAALAQKQLHSLLGFKMSIYETEAKAKARKEAEAAAEAKVKAEEAHEVPQGVEKPKERACDGWIKLLSMLPQKSKKAKASTSGSVSESSSTKSGAESGGVLASLRGGWNPFDGPPPKSNGEKPKEKPPKKKKQTVDKSTDESLAAVSPVSRSMNLPTMLGRTDVFKKRKRDDLIPEMKPVQLVIGKDGVTDARLAKKMERSQDYTVRKNRSDIFMECVDAWRAAPASVS